MVNIIQKFMTRNECYIAGKPLMPTKLVLHATATKGVMARTWFDRWNKAGVYKCVHAFIDDTVCMQYLPWDMRGWHAGGTANNFAIGIEMCEDSYWTEPYFRKTIANTVEVYAMLCKKYKLNPLTDIISHSEGYKLGWCSNHADPEHWFKKFGYTMNDFRKAVDAIVNPVLVQVSPVTVAIPTWKQHIVGQEVKDLQADVNKYFGKTVLTVDGYYGDDTKNGVPNNVHYGEVEPIVGEIQKRLNKLGFNVGIVDNSFGAKTLAGVKAFQKSRGLGVDGIVGRGTFDYLYRK